MENADAQKTQRRVYWRIKERQKMFNEIKDYKYAYFTAYVFTNQRRRSYGI